MASTDSPRGFVHYFSDFMDVALDTTNDYSSGTENSGTLAVNVQENGVARLTTGATSGNRIGLGVGLLWQANNGGPLWMEARIKSVTAITTRHYFVGFTDVLPGTTLESPIEQSGTTLTNTATDAVGFMYDTASDNDTWHLVGVKAGAGATSVNTTDAPAAAATYETLRVVVNADGHAEFFKNGEYMGKVTNAVSAGVSLTPIVLVETRTTAASVVDVDYIEVKGARI